MSKQKQPVPPQQHSDNSQTPDKIPEEIEQIMNQLKRAQADFVNYKKRIERDQEQFVQVAYSDVLIRILPVLDSFQRVVEHVPTELARNEWVKGVLQTARQLEESVKQMGLEKITALGEAVNPEIHEVVTQGPGKKDIVIEELEKGYQFRGRTIRPARVRVGDGTKTSE